MTDEWTTVTVRREDWKAAKEQKSDSESWSDYLRRAVEAFENQE